MLVLLCVLALLLGLGPPTAVATPALPASNLSLAMADLPPLQDIVAIAAGIDHTCALTSGGGVKCWGANGAGQLGDGTGTWTARSTPADVVGLAGGVVAIAAGGAHTCALMDAVHGDGVKCWGQNYFGQLGDGTTIWRLTPVAVVGLSSGVTAIAAGGYHTCALTSGGGVKCWGWDGSGQLGLGTITYRTTPVDVVMLLKGYLPLIVRERPSI